jgi:hypothetical protein
MNLPQALLLLPLIRRKESMHKQKDLFHQLALRLLNQLPRQSRIRLCSL